MTHKDLVIRAVRWLKNQKKCGVILHEWSSAAMEYPDAIGWRMGWESYLVECKVSVSDFCADQRKSFRRMNTSAGKHRYYMTPAGLLTNNGAEQAIAWMKERCPGWGLLEVRGRFIDVILEAEDQQDFGARHEIQFMYSAIRRLQGGWPTPNLHVCEVCAESECCDE